jgi:hypothetical protein
MIWQVYPGIGCVKPWTTPLACRGCKKCEKQRVGKLLWVNKQRGFQIRILHAARPGGEEKFTDGGDNLAESAT